VLRNTTNQPLAAVFKFMGDPRNVAHAKKVLQEKHHKHAQTPASKPARKKRQTENKKEAAAVERDVATPEAEKPARPPDSVKLEQSRAVLSKLKELEFHSRSNIEKLAELSLTIEEELKQKAFAEEIGAVYAAQDAFQSKIVKLIEDYEAECTHLAGPA